MTIFVIKIIIYSTEPTYSNLPAYYIYKLHPLSPLIPHPGYFGFESIYVIAESTALYTGAYNSLPCIPAMRYAMSEHYY